MDDWGFGEVLAVSAIAIVGVSYLIVLAFLARHTLRSPDLSRAARLGWLLVLLVPVVGPVSYLVVRAPALSRRPDGRSGDGGPAIRDAGDPDGPTSPPRDGDVSR